MDEQLKVKHIPYNFENGINILGMSFKPLFLIEGLFLGIGSFILSFMFIKEKLNVTDNSTIIGYCLVLSGILLFIGIKGFNDEPLSTFFINILHFYKGRRIAFYNPRVKCEAISYWDENLDNNTEKSPISKEKILSFIKEFQEKTPVKKTNADTVFNPNSMKFIDDMVLEEKTNEK